MHLKSISDDDLCADCACCIYRPGEFSACVREGDNGEWPATFAASGARAGYAIECESFIKIAQQGDNAPKSSPSYRVYCDGLEYGIDYATLAMARAAKASYAASFPHHRYYIRKVR